MKLVYKFSPNYRDDLSTKEIMLHLLVGLLVVFIATDIYYFVEYGAAFGIRAIGLLVSSVVAATLTEVVWCLVLKKDIKTFLSSSFPWITAIILTLTVQV
ncbi:MAG: RnfABCDGE type electron transport complex subunit D, partial [Bacillota bacterium]|nr:RnfABCDGE type electron transport complex subunit D [Bacillota bacterium]NLP21933.1 RnfABCDGE type electron transport complex subunit D [Erysipelotrichaceae bacterium]